jgi:hypothetical protein
MWTGSITDGKEPKQDTPKSDKKLPALKVPLKDMVLPECRKSKTGNEVPGHVFP